MELLPGATFGHILHYLNNNTGSKKVTNPADGPVILRYAFRIANTSKAMSAKFNDSDAVQLFLASLSERFNLPCVHFASIMNTKGTRRWMWNYIQGNRDAKNYQVDKVLDIFKVVLEVLKKYEGAALWTAISNRPGTEYGRCSIVTTPFGNIHYDFVNAERKPIRISPKDTKDAYVGLAKNTEHAWFIWETLKTERLGLDPIPMEPMPKPKVHPKIRNLTKWAVDLAVQLEKQPHHSLTDFKGYTSLRRMELERDSIDTLCALSFAAGNLSKQLTEWVLCTYDNDPKALYLERPTIRGFPNEFPCNVRPLKEAFISVIMLIGLDWKQAALKDYPDLVNIKSEEDYVLLIKDKRLVAVAEEANLINCIAVQLGLSTTILSGESKNLNYLWVKKEGLQGTLKALNINL